MERQKNICKQTGITLIALVITIIVLLILAIVSIKLIWDGGIITHAKNAVDKYGKAQQNEIDQINHIFGNNGEQNNAPDELIKYVLGEDLKGQALSNIVNESDGTMKPLNGENVELLNIKFYNYMKDDEEAGDIIVYIKYKNKGYKVLSEGIDSSHFDLDTTKSVNLIYEPKGDEGKTVEYSIDGTEENKKEWTILYDNGDNIEIVSPESMGNLTLGKNDEQVTGNNGFEKAVNSYNNAIDRINIYASSFVTNTNKISVRSVGSNPTSPNSRNTEKYISEKLESWNCKYNENGTKIPVTINGVGECSDNNYEQDLVRMSYFGVAGIGDYYWLASRYVRFNSNYVYFNVSTVSSDGYLDSNELCYACSDGYTNAGYVYEHESEAVRPVVKINK